MSRIILVCCAWEKGCEQRLGQLCTSHDVSLYCHGLHVICRYGWCDPHLRDAIATTTIPPVASELIIIIIIITYMLWFPGDFLSGEHGVLVAWFGAGSPVAKRAFAVAVGAIVIMGPLSCCSSKQQQLQFVVTLL